MVSYDHDHNDPKLYQTGCFWVVRSSLFEKHKWDSTIEYYAERSGKENEDLEYSRRLKQAGYKLKFDKNNLVWHWDEAYQQVDIGPKTSVCLRKKDLPKNFLKDLLPKEEFTNLVQSL